MLLHNHFVWFSVIVIKLVQEDSMASYLFLFTGINPSAPILLPKNGDFLLIFFLFLEADPDFDIDQRETGEVACEKDRDYFHCRLNPLYTLNCMMSSVHLNFLSFFLHCAGSITIDFIAALHSFFRVYCFNASQYSRCLSSRIKQIRNNWFIYLCE